MPISPRDYKSFQVERVPLSVICADESDKITERNRNHLLRPIFINGVEAGFAHSQGKNAVKKLSARGITITLWYFISRGHQAQALLPFCFKNYPDKSDCWDELMALHRTNLLEFTPGNIFYSFFARFGAEKYVEVNRIMAKRAREHGGCMVARSQMHAIVERDPLLDRTVEKKLLMPSFNGNDVIFPIDGPLGRNGCTLAETLICTFEDSEWPRCALQQMNLRDQRIWMTNLANITQNAQWIKTAGRVCRYHSLNLVTIPPERRPPEKSLFQLHPSETNPPANRGFSKPQCRAPRTRFFNHNRYNQRPCYNNSGMNHFSTRRRSWTTKRGFSNSNYYFVPSYRRNPHKFDEKKVSYIGRPNSLYRLIAPSHTSAKNNTENEKPISRQKPEAADNLNRLANAKSICDQNPNLVKKEDGLNKLANLILEQTEHEKKQDVKNDNDGKEDKNEEQEQQQDEEEDKKKEKEKNLLEEIKKHSSEGTGSTSVVPNGAEKDQLVSRKDNNTVSSVINAELKTEFTNKAVICSGSDDAESAAAVGIAGGDNDLICFSDSELENEDDHSLRDAEILM
ncbi:unnamed protein product [Onchocerca flexuosa]|uniref:RNase_Zc3h12a domain-containing protein n=1 Tax=Onchocerca flexuosa TaxID=387005 RepID=A0A183HZK5_9BILA|nr:unnamed protein product [Onchocerca flexuosa]